MKIMIVDDHPDMRRMLRSIVAIASGKINEIIECEDGYEAVEKYSSEHPELVLMDIQLKDENGFEVAERIYKHDPKAKIIFVTSHDTESHRSKAQTLHALGFISKENLSELDLMIHHS